MPIIGMLNENDPAYKAGLRVGDIIETVNYKEVTYSVDFYKELRNALTQDDMSEKSVVLGVIQNGNAIEIPVALEFDENGYLTSFIELSFDRVVRRNPIAAVGKAVPETIRMGGKIFQFLKRMIVRDVPMKYVAGPVGIAQVAVAVVETGVASALRFAGFLSVNLGIVNLLPLFITDGAMLIFY